MTYNECDDLMSKHIDSLRSELFFTISGKPAMFVSLFAAPDNSDTEFRQTMHDTITTTSIIDRDFLFENDMLNDNLKVFIVYKQDGRQIIMVFESFLSSLNRVS